MIDDRRTPEDKARTVGFVVATDSFMSGWGQAPGRSLFAVPLSNWDQEPTVTANMDARSDMKRVRTVGKDYRPHLAAGDHLSIRDMSDCSRFYEPGGFHKEAQR